jgi:hypothetical protein
MRAVYGKSATRIELTPSVLEVSWSSSRGQIAQTCDIRIKEAPQLEAAGFLMLFAKDLKEADQFFHGPIIHPERDDKTLDLQATAYEISWYLGQNDISRPRVNGDAGKELERLIRSTGINFSCSAFGFTVKDRLPTQSYAALYTSLTEQAYEKTGIRYFVQVQRDKLYVLPEGGNSYVPVLRAAMLERSSTGENLEGVYTVVTVERYKGDQQLGSVTKEDSNLIKKIGRMHKIIDAGEDTDLSGIASRQLGTLSKIPKTRSITVHHSDPGAAKIRAGWLIKIMEKDNKTTTDWIVTTCNAHWKGGVYTMDLQLERRG